MKHLLLSLSLLTTAAGLTAAEPTLYGVKLYCEEGCSSGLYSLDTTPGSQPVLEWMSGDMMGNGGSVYADGTLYVLNYLDFYGTLFWTYLICDVENQTMDAVMPELSFPDTGSAMTFDPTTGNVYSICIDADDTTLFTLSTMNLADGSKKPIARIERMGALAADQYGNLFGIGMDGNLYKVNKFTAELTLIGSTGLSPRNNQSAVIDYSTGVLYWNAITDDGAYLYTVDTTTAEATLITVLENKFQFAGIFIKQSAAQEGSPTQPLNLSANFEKDSHEGTLSFTMPETDSDGNPLIGNLDYVVKCGESQVAEGEAAPGAGVSVEVNVPKAANYQFFVTASNQSGVSAPASITLWIGMDTPRAVTDCKATIEGNLVTLDWILPETGVNGGYIDPEQVRYVIIRGPYSTMIDFEFKGTVFTETFDQEGVHPLMYGIHSYIDPEVVSEMTMSNVITAGEYWNVPFAEDLSDPFRSLVFTVHDANSDDCTWNYDYDFEAMRCMWPLADESDDWLVSAPVKLESSKSYVVSATVRSEGKWNFDEQCYDPVYSGNLGIWLGSSTSYDSMNRQLLEPTEVSLINDHQLTTAAFSPDTDGIYHVGLHHSGPRSIYYMLLNRLDVKEFDPTSIAVSSTDTKITYNLISGGIIINNPTEIPVVLTGIDGQTIFNASSAEISAIVTPGVYVLSAGGQSHKIAIH